jgi:catechol 2,3-dioxygenase-like lactoylglutathione lyase family enzyme
VRAWPQFVTFLRVADLDVSQAFYQELLGLELVLDQGPCRIFSVGGGAFLGVCEGTPVPDGVIVTLVDPDVERRWEELTARGVQFERALAHNPAYDITHAFLRDPDGHLVEIQRFEDPAWPQPESG